MLSGWISLVSATSQIRQRMRHLVVRVRTTPSAQASRNAQVPANKNNCTAAEGEAHQYSGIMPAYSSILSNTLSPIPSLPIPEPNALYWANAGLETASNQAHRTLGRV